MQIKAELYPRPRPDDRCCTAVKVKWPGKGICFVKVTHKIDGQLFCRNHAGQYVLRCVGG